MSHNFLQSHCTLFHFWTLSFFFKFSFFSKLSLEQRNAPLLVSWANNMYNGFISTDVAASSEVLFTAPLLNDMFICTGCDFMTVFVHYHYGFLKPLVTSIYVQARYHQYHQKSDNLYPFSPWKINISHQHSPPIEVSLSQKLNSYLVTYWFVWTRVLVEYQTRICTKYLIICNRFGRVKQCKQHFLQDNFLTTCLTSWRLFE